jgi:uncharacterized protein (TIRG00374 family)
MATLTTAYIVLACYGLLLAFGLLVNPRAVRSFLIWLFNTRLLKRWHHIGEKVGSDLVAASDEYKAYDWRFWLKIIASTVIAWSARFFVVNGLLLAFSGGDLSFDLHLLAWGRQSVLFILMFVAITPGGSGLAEFSFVQVLSDICPNPPGAGTLAFLWRLIGFYPYMLLGAWLVPRWIRRIKRK